MTCTDSDTALVYVDICMDVDDQAENSIRVFPNPADHVLNITSDQQLPLVVSLYDVTGKLLLCEQSSTSFLQLNTSGLESGTYFVVIDNSVNRITEKVVIVR